MPHFTSPHLVYDHRTATFYDEYVSLATVDGRIETDYVLPDEERDTPHAEYLFSDEYETTGAELHYSNDNWMLHIHCEKDVEPGTSEQTTTENGTVLGVDLGVNNLAVASTGTFWTGDEFDHWRREYENRRGDLQACGTDGHTRIYRQLAATRKADSSRRSTGLRTSWWLKPAATSVR